MCLTYALEKPGADFWALGVKSNSHAWVESLLLLVLLGGLADVVDGVLVVLVAAVGEVHARHVHAGVDHVHQEVDRL